MLRFGDYKPIPLTALLDKRAETVVLDDFFSLYEYHFNAIRISWSAEDGIDEVQIDLPEHRTPGSEPGIKPLVLRSGQPQEWFPPVFFVGAHDIKMKISGKEIILRLQLNPSKISEKMYYGLLNDLAARSLSIYRKTSPARTFAGTVKLAPFSKLYEQYTAIKKDMEMLKRVVERIAECPRKNLRRTYAREPLYLASDIDENTIYDMCACGGGLAGHSGRGLNPRFAAAFTSRAGRSYIPESVLSSRSETDYNVFENRLLKRFLKLIALNMKSLSSKIRNDPSFPDRDICVETCARLRRDALNMLRLPFLEEVEEERELIKTSLALRGDLQYMRFYEIFKRFISRPYHDRSYIYDIGIDELWRLYEYWSCVFVFDTMLMFENDGWEITEQNLMKIDELGFESRLHEGKLLLAIEKKDKAEKIEMIFQYEIQSFVQQKTGGSKKPDIALIRYKKGNGQYRFANMMILDAKYRRNLTSEHGENSGRTAVNDMHIYRDAFRDEQGHRKCGWAIMLYPGETPEYKASQHNRIWHDSNGNSGIIAICIRPHDDIETQKKDLFRDIKSCLLERDIGAISFPNLS